jgi:hypothetical protein
LGSSHQSMPSIKKKIKKIKKEETQWEKQCIVDDLICSHACQTGCWRLSLASAAAILLRFGFLVFGHPLFYCAALSHMIIKLMRITSALSTLLKCIYLKWSAFLPLSKKEASLLIHVTEKFLFWSLNLFLFSPAAPS